MMQRLLLLSLLGSAFACQEAPTSVLLQVPGGRDAGVVGRDGGRPPMRRDGGVGDSGPMDLGPLPPSNRTLTTYRIMGETPIENLVMNPQLDLHTVLTLFTSSGFGRRHQLPSSPSGLPVLEIYTRDDVFIPVQPRARPLEASIWLGRRGSVPISSEALLVGLTRNAGLQQAALLVEAGSRREHDGIVWERFSGTISETLLGQAQLIVNNLSDAPLFVTGPVVVPIESGVRASRSIAPEIEMRRIDEDLRAKLGVIAARARQELERSLRAP